MQSKEETHKIIRKHSAAHINIDLSGTCTPLKTSYTVNSSSQLFKQTKGNGFCTQKPRGKSTEKISAKMISPVSFIGSFRKKMEDYVYDQGKVVGYNSNTNTVAPQGSSLIKHKSSRSLNTTSCSKGRRVTHQVTLSINAKPK